MRLKPIVFFLIVGSLAGFLVFRQARDGAGGGLINIGQKAPDFEVTDLNGNKIKLSDYRGKLVFLNFWATWCGPCVEEMPDMEMLYHTLKDRPFQMIAISVDTSDEEIKRFYKTHQLSLPTAWDPGRQISGTYHVDKFPETFIIDRNGYVVKHYYGAEKWANPQMFSRIEAMIREQETGDSVSTP